MPDIRWLHSVPGVGCAMECNSTENDLPAPSPLIHEQGWLQWLLNGKEHSGINFEIQGVPEKPRREKRPHFHHFMKRLLSIFLYIHKFQLFRPSAPVRRIFTSLVSCRVSFSLRAPQRISGTFGVNYRLKSRIGY